MSCNETVRVARHVKHAHSGLPRQQVLCQHSTVHPGHDNVGQQEIKGPAKTSCDFEGFFATPRREDFKSARFQIRLREFSQWLRILCQENAFRTRQRFNRTKLALFRLRLTYILGEINLKGRAASECALHPNVSVTLLDNAVDGCQTQPSSFAPFLGREEWLKHMCERGRVHANPRVSHGQANIRTFSGAWMTSGVDLIQDWVTGLNFEFAARWHGITSIDGQIHDDLFDLTLIRLYAAEGRAQVE